KFWKNLWRDNKLTIFEDSENTNININKIELQILRGYLEELIFNEKDLNILKESINSLSVGKITAKSVKKLILKLRYKIMNELLEFIPFQIQKKLECQILEEKPNIKEINELEKKIHERDELLIELAERLARISKKLQKNNKN
ncbi:MAG: hypothetical protein ACTSVV_05230, partial [Promethearchaeota archaeon]